MKETDRIIQMISSLSVAYKRYIAGSEATRALHIMWETGEILKKYIDEHAIYPYRLFMEIYGKSEQNPGIIQHSYISYAFQSRCYRVRKFFPSKESISATFPDLKDINLFIAILPFLDNPKYRLKEQEYHALIKMINGRAILTKKKQYIRSLKNKGISRKSHHNGLSEELRDDKAIFDEFYNSILTRIEFKDFQKATEDIDPVFYGLLSKNTSALSSDGLKTYDFDLPVGLDDTTRDYYKLLKKYIGKPSGAELHRFRRLITQRKMVDLAEMLFALTNAEAYQILAGK